MESTSSRTSPTAWKYQSAEEMKSSAMVHFGKVKVPKLYPSVFFVQVGMYGGGGSVQNLHSLKNVRILDRKGSN